MQMITDRENTENIAVLSVDDYTEKIVTGSVWFCNDERAHPFQGLMQLLLLLDGKAALTTDKRCKRFAREERTDRETETEAGKSADPRRGALATFRLRLLFRQNSSWQGLVSWVEGRQEESFRSTLELLMLLDSALRAADESKNQPEPAKAVDNILEVTA